MTEPWAYYNEFDEYAADWLENLIARGLIAPGVVDRRSIVDVQPDDLRGFRQCHFFAGIGVWSYGLRRAGVSDDTPLWTGSPPCQPFSAAGQRGGVDDERHLWPALFHLIGERRPERFFGEQVASKDGLGWLDLVLTDMEKAGYAVWAVDTCSAGSGAPHIRQRLRICAYDLGPASNRLDDANRTSTRRQIQAGRQFDGLPSATDGLDDGIGSGLEGLGDGHRAETGQREGPLRPVATAGGIDWVADADGGNAGPEWQQHGWEQRQQSEDGGRRHRSAPNRPSPTNGFWGDADWLFCRDGKWRPVEPGTFPLVDGAAFRVGSGSPFEGRSRQGMLKGYGNAIDAEATIDFITACLEADWIDIDHEPNGTSGAASAFDFDLLD